MAGMVLYERHLLVVHYSNSCLYVYNSTLGLTDSLTVPGIGSPRHIVVSYDVRDHVVMSDWKENKLHWVNVRVHRGRVQLGQVRSIRLTYRPWGMCVSSSGQLVVCSPYMNRLYKYSSQGECEGHVQLSPQVRPYFVTSSYTDDDYVISDYDNDNLLWVRGNGTVTHTVYGNDSHAVQGKNCQIVQGRQSQSLHCMNSGTECDNESHSVQDRHLHTVRGRDLHTIQGELSPSLSHDSHIVHNESDHPLQLCGPCGLIHDIDGRVLVADNNSHRVVTYDRYGQYAGQLLTQQDGIYLPHHLLLDKKNDTLYVSCQKPVQVMIYRYSTLLTANIT